MVWYSQLFQNFPQFVAENPRDGGAWWAAVSGAAQSRTRLKRLRSSSSRHNTYDNNSTKEAERNEIILEFLYLF